MNFLDYFKKISSEITHGNSDYFSHSFGVYNILKELNLDEYICVAGLYHSIYDTENFKVDLNLERKTIIEIIGEKSENLVFIFCHLRDRFNSIINNHFEFSTDIHLSLCYIEYANLKEQYSRIMDPILAKRCLELQEKITELTKPANFCLIDNKKLYIFDNLLEKNHIEFLNQYCHNSVYRPDHKSNNSVGIDCRFSATISPEEFEQTKLIPIISKIACSLKTSLYIGKHYINHYGFMTGVSEHCDADEPGQYTILIFPNNVWVRDWGGEICFYSEGNIHNMIEYKPGRIIVFDGRISHKVLPLTRNSQSDRYSIAIKTCTEEGLSYFQKIYQPYIRI
jgi:hypothetical protein